MGTSTPLLDRIRARKGQIIGPVSPTSIIDKMSPFAKRLAEKRLPVKGWLHDGCGPDGTAA